MDTLLIVLLVLLVLAFAGGGYGHYNRGWGYAGWSPFGLILLVIVLLLLTGNLHVGSLGAITSSGLLLLGVVDPNAQPPGGLTPQSPSAIILPANPVEPKPWYMSRTVLLGTLVTLLGIAGYFGNPVNTPVMTVSSIATAVSGVLVIVVRAFTGAPIEGTSLARAQTIYHQALRGLPRPER